MAMMINPSAGYQLDFTELPTLGSMQTTRKISCR